VDLVTSNASLGSHKTRERERGGKRGHTRRQLHYVGDELGKGKKKSIYRCLGRGPGSATGCSLGISGVGNRKVLIREERRGGKEVGGGRTSNHCQRTGKKQP